MKHSATRVAIGFAGILAAGAWPVVVLAQASEGSQGGGTGSETGSFGSGQQQGGEPTGAFGGGQQQQGVGEAQVAPLDSMGRNFLNQAARDNSGELKIAQLAEQKAESPEVRDFARSLVEQHQRMSTQVQQLASQHNITLPSTPAPVEQRKYQDLSRLSGNDFDRQFLNTIVLDHQKDISNFEKIANSTTVNSQVQSWAVQTLPALRNHLIEARNIQKQVEGQQQGQNQGIQGQGQPQGGMKGGETQP